MDKEEIDDIKNRTQGILYITKHKRFWNYFDKLQRENKQLKEMIDEQDGCNKRRLQIFDLKDKLCKELKNVKLLKQENKQLKELIYKDNTGALIITLNKEMELQERIDKAIEWFNNADRNKLQELLQILKGE